MKILTGDHKVLREKSKRVANIDDIVRSICCCMVDLMLSNGGIGLAANQVGIAKRIIIVSHNNKPIVMINPEIIDGSIEKETDFEGCLSIPSKYIPLDRYKKVLVKYRDTKGRPHKEYYTDLSARIIQHEIDHLNGILMTDYPL